MWVKRTSNPLDWLTANPALGKSGSTLRTPLTARDLRAMHTTQLCLPTLTHPFPSGPAKELLCFSQSDQSQHIGWILPIRLQQLHLANNDEDAATDQFLIKSRFFSRLGS